MKKMTGKRIIPLIAALLALSMLITVFAMPDPLNVDRWPDPSNNGEAAILPGLHENYYISPDNWKRTDYTSTYFSDNPLKPGEREDAAGYCYFAPRQSGIVYSMPVPSSARHAESGENGYIADLSFPVYEKNANPTRHKSIGEHRPAVKGVDLYYPVDVSYAFTYGGVERKTPFYLIGYREDYRAKSSDLANYLPLASSLASVLRDLDDTMLKIEAQQTGQAKVGDYQPIYDYMLYGVRIFLAAKFTYSEPEDGKWTTAFTETSMSNAIKAGNVCYEPDQLRALIAMARKYLTLAEENRIAEPQMNSFSLGDYPGYIDQKAGTVTVYLPEGNSVDLATVQPEITTNADTRWKLKSGSLAEKNAVYNVAAYDRTSTITYDGKKSEYYEFWGNVQKDYTVNIVTGSPETKVTGLTVELDGDTYEATVDQANKKIALTLPERLKTGDVTGAVTVTHTGTSAELQDASGVALSGETTALNQLKKVHIADTVYNQTADYTVEITWVKSSECKILSFKLGSYEGTIDEQNHSVTIKIPYGKDISSLTPAVTVSDHATCVRTGDSTGWEFGTPVTYQVTAEDGTSQLYTVTAVQADVTESCEMTSFKIGNSEGVIDQTAGTVTVTVPADTNLSIATPVIGIPEGAKVSPASGERVDLTNPVTYTVTGISGDTKTYTVTAAKVSADIDKKLQGRCQDMVDKIIARYRTTANDNWEWMNIGFYDHQKREPGDALPQTLNLETAVKKLARNKMTDYDRGIMMLTALGVDCTKLDEYNDGKKIIHSSGEDISDLVAQLYNYPEDDTINGPVFWLIAMDMGNYTVPKDAKYTRETMLDTVVNHVYGSDGFDLDMVCMLMQGLYPYRNEPAVQAKLQEGLQIILGEKKISGIRGMENGYLFYSTGSYNSEVTAQVICALCSMGIDPATDPRFSDGNGNNVIKKWLDTYASEADGYFYHITSGDKDQMATYQACYAMQWYLGFLENGGAGHPYSLYADGFDFNKSFSKEANITSFKLEGKTGVIDEDAATITVTLPEGISLSGLTPEIELSEGAKLLSPDLPYSFIKDEPVAFQVQAEDGETTKIYHVTVTQSAGVTSSGTTLKADTIGIQDVNQRGLEIQKITTSTGADGVMEIELLLGPEADLTQLRLYAETSERATSDVSLNYKKVLDLSDWVTITLTAEDGTTRAYRIKATKNTYASIAAFSISIGEERYNGTIDHDKGQILIQGVPSNADVTALVPNITLSEGTTRCIPLSGTAQDFTNPVDYTVTGDGLIAKTYQVTVLKNGAAVNPSTPGEVLTAPSITTFSIDGCQGVIDDTAGTIQVTMPMGTDTTSLIPSVSVSSGATVTPVSGAAVNLSAPVVYTVSNSRGSRTYTVTVVLEKSISNQLWEQMEQNNTIKDEQVSHDHSTLSGGGKSDGGSYNYDQTSKDHSWLSR